MPTGDNRRWVGRHAAAVQVTAAVWISAVLLCVSKYTSTSLTICLLTSDVHKIELVPDPERGGESVLAIWSVILQDE